jgi:DNA-binding MarR family transcriptional regulator
VSTLIVDALERLVTGAVAITARATSGRSSELTILQWRVLVIVGEEPGGATVTQVANRIGSQRSPTSRLVTRLRRRDLVAVARDETDHRVTRVTLTTAGQALRSTVIADRRAQLDELVREISPISIDDARTIVTLGRAFGRRA